MGERNDPVTVPGRAAGGRRRSAMMTRVGGEFWQQVLDNGGRVPADRPLDDLTHELFEMLGDADPQVRDGVARRLLTDWICEGVYDDLLSGLGDGAVVGLRSGLGGAGDDSVFRRSYSARVLGDVVARANATAAVPPSQLLTWGDRAMTWFTRERDLRGFVPGKGWARPVVHGAGLMGRLARSADFGVHELTVMLDVVADRLLLPTRHLLHHDEDDHLAYAVMTVLHRNVVPLSVTEPWLARLGGALTPPDGDAEWPTPSAVNTKTFLRALHLQLLIGVQGQGLHGDRALFGAPPRDRADLILTVLEQLRNASPAPYATAAVRGVPT
jgi:hypothetical protein